MERILIVDDDRTTLKNLRHILGVRAGLDLLHGTDPDGLTGTVIEFASIVWRHEPCLP